MYGISDSSQLNSLFGIGRSSFSLPSTLRLPQVSPTTSLYGINTARPTGEDRNLLKLKQAAGDLKSSLEDISRGVRGDMFNGLTAKSSDAGVVTAEPGAGYAARGQTNVEVSALATAQTSQSNAMRADGFNFKGGRQGVSIDFANGRSVSLSVNVGGRDNNETVLTRLADAVNGSGAGVTANVVKNDRDNTVSLQFSGDFTGKSSAFGLKDSFGSLMGTMGVNTTSEATDARYTVNGRREQSSENSFEYRGVNFAINGTGRASVTLDRNNSAAAGAISAFTDAYNRLTELNPRVAAQTADASNSYGAALRNAGFSISDDGRISISDESLEKGIAAIRQVFDGGSNFGYAARLSQIASAAENRPQLYASGANTYGSYNADRVFTQQNQVSYMLGMFYNSVI